MGKQASTNHPVHALIADRWSPYGFDDRSVSRSDLCSLFEAARWAASSFNEQPWSYIVAEKGEEDEFQRLLACLVEANQQWAQRAPVLALGVAHLRFARNDKPNRHAFHDLGLSVGNLTLEATARGIAVHQMAGILPEVARESYGIPDGWEAVAALAIGYAADPNRLPEALRARDLAPRQRKGLGEFVFRGSWNSASKIVT